VAIYHLSVKPVKRAAGRSVTAAAAYRAADRIRDQQTGQVFDYTRKRGVVHAEIVLPSDAARSTKASASDSLSESLYFKVNSYSIAHSG
jgi:hypothetical protein